MILPRLRRFLRDDSGSASIETLLVFPMLAWVFLATFEYFDAFRAKSLNVKATYTIADILSRETNEPITPVFLDSLNTLFASMSPHSTPTMVRVTAVVYLSGTDTYRVVWSQVRGTGSPLNDASIAAARSKVLPVMHGGEVGILVETVSRFAPTFPYVGLSAFDIQNVMLIRPRFTPQLCWSSSNTGPWTTANRVCNV